MSGSNIDRRNTRWQRSEVGEAEMAAETEGGGWGEELPAADGSQSQWGMEGDPAVTLKQQVEAIISSGMADWMSAHTLISSRPSGPPESACMCSFSEELRRGVKLFNYSPPSPVRLTESLLFHRPLLHNKLIFLVSVLTLLQLPLTRIFCDTQQNCSLMCSCFMASQG